MPNRDGVTVPGPVTQPTRVVTGEVTTAACAAVVVVPAVLSAAAVAGAPDRWPTPVFAVSRSRRAHITSPTSGTGSAGAVGESVMAVAAPARDILGCNVFGAFDTVSMARAGTEATAGVALAAVARC